MHVIYEFNDQHIKSLHQLYQQEWWTKDRSLQDTERCVKGSSINIGIVDKEDQLIGYARVLSDYIFKAIIFDIIISQHHRANGLGSQLLNLVKNHQQLTQVKHFELYCLPEMFSFYQQHGFSADVGDIQLMRHTL